MQYLLILLLSLPFYSIDAQAAKGGRWVDENTDSGSDPVKSKGKGKNRQTDATDTTAPVLTVPADIRESASSPNGAVVVFSASAQDNEDGTVLAQCTPQSGDVFSLGSSTVQCSASDQAGNTQTAAFVVTVVDDEAPVISVPASISVDSSNGEALAIDYTDYGVTAVDAIDTAIDFFCTPASGSAFPIGSTQVQCVAVDSADNTANASFAVTVEDTSPPLSNNTPPVVAFLSPANNSILQVGDAVSIAITASDSDGSIQFCQLYHNQDLVRRENHAPYEWGQDALDTPLLNLQEGVAIFTASCTDNDNLESSASITLLVEAIPEPTVADVLLDWVAPSTREDGTPLSVGDIDSYEIYYYTAGNSHSGTSVSVPSQNATGNLITSHQISSVVEGSYYFSIATVDTSGNVSAFAEPVKLVVP